VPAALEWLSAEELERTLFTWTWQFWAGMVLDLFTDCWIVGCGANALFQLHAENRYWLPLRFISKSQKQITCSHRPIQGGPKGPRPAKFLENIVFLCFERRVSEQISIIRLKSNNLPPHFWTSYATACRRWKLRAFDHSMFSKRCQIIS